MTKKELFKQLNILCNDMNMKYRINSGGCCYVAAVIAEFLEDRNIEFCCYEKYYPCHYMIRVSDRFINRGEFNTSDIEMLDDSSSKFLYDLYYNNDWNTTYDRSWNLIVKTKIKALFNKYDSSRR